MKKTLVILLSIVLIVAMFSGCNTNVEPEAVEETGSNDEVVVDEPEVKLSGKLTFSVWDLERSPYLQEIVDGYSAMYPEVEVEVLDILAADYDTKLNIDLNGGAAADVIMIKNASSIPVLVDKGQLEDLNAYVAKDGVDVSVYNGLADSLVYNDVLSSLPVRTDYYSIFYNKDLFDAAGVAYPSNDMTWAEFEEIAMKVTSGEGADKIYGAYFHSWNALVQNWGVQDGENTILGPDYEFMRPAYEMVLRMQEEGSAVDFGTIKSAGLHYKSIFENGTIAMVPMGTWLCQGLRDAVAAGDTDVNWGIARLPHFDGVEAGYTVGSTTPIGVNAASENKDAAWAFVKYMTGPEAAKIMAESGVFPAYANDPSLLEAIANLEGMPEGALEALTVTNISLDRPIAQFVTEVNQALGEEHSLIMLGESTLDEGLAAFAERSKEIQGLD